MGRQPLIKPDPASKCLHARIDGFDLHASTAFGAATLLERFSPDDGVVDLASFAPTLAVVAGAAPPAAGEGAVRTAVVRALR